MRPLKRNEVPPCCAKAQSSCIKSPETESHAQPNWGRVAMSTSGSLGVLGVLMFLNISAAGTPKSVTTDPEKGVATNIQKKDWPSFRNGNQLLGEATSSLPDKLELLWTFSAGEMVASTAAIVDGRVYVGSLNGDLFCLNLATGKEIWKYHTLEKPDPKSFSPGFKSSPTVTADAVYLGDEDGVFHAVDRATGKKRWTFQTDAEIVSSAAIVDDRVIFGSHDNSLYCLNTKDGSKVWQIVTQGPVNCSPAIMDGFTFVTGCDEHLRVIDIATGEEKTDIPMNTYLIASPAVDGAMLYVGTYASEVVAVNWKTKATVWAYKDPNRDFPYHSSAAVSNDYIVVGSRDKRLHAIDRKTGNGAWTFATRGKVDSSPVIVDNRVFVGSQDGNLYELRLSDGKELWRYTDGKPFTASPAIGEGCLVIGSESNDGFVYCFGKKSKKS